MDADHSFAETGDAVGGDWIAHAGAEEEPLMRRQAASRGEAGADQVGGEEPEPEEASRGAVFA